jgi:hypothetical protein
MPEEIEIDSRDTEGTRLLELRYWKIEDFIPIA